MNDPKPWLTLARVPGLHAGHLAGAGQDPLAWLEDSAASSRSRDSARPRSRRCATPIRGPSTATRRWLAEPRPQSRRPGARPTIPPLLARYPDAPLVLFVDGAVDALSLPQLAIVGSRNPTQLGRETAEQFARHLAGGRLHHHERTRARHRRGQSPRCAAGAVAGRSRCSAAGLDTVYPPSTTQPWHEAIAAHGALVSDPAVGTPPLKQHFPRRNRIISGLSVGTLVVEAAIQSGSLITARLAAEQGREVFAIPGLDPQPAGARLPPPDPAGRKAGRNRGRHIRRAGRPAARPARRSSESEAPDSHTSFRPRVGQGPQNPVRCARLRAGRHRLARRAHRARSRRGGIDAAHPRTRRTGGPTARRSVRPATAGEVRNEGRRSRHPDLPLRELLRR